MIWHYEWCPICAGTGRTTVITTVSGDHDGAGRARVSTTTSASETCGACDGIGHIKIPNGYHLAPDVTFRVLPSTRSWGTTE